jgi:hypothetical protein
MPWWLTPSTRIPGRTERSIRFEAKLIPRPRIFSMMFPALLFWEVAETERIIEVIIHDEIGNNNHPQ